MASPFAIFRKHQRLAMALVTFMAMIAFVFLDTLGRTLGGGRGAGAAVAVETSAGNLTQVDLQNLIQRRQRANQFVVNAFLEAHPEFRNFPPQFLEMQLGQMQFQYGRETQEADVLFGYLLREEGRRMGIVVSDEQIEQFIDQLTSRKLSSNQFRALTRNLHLDPKDLYDILRDELQAQMTMRMARPMNPQPPEQYWKFYRQLNQRQRIEVAALPVKEFVDQVPEPAAGELQTFFDAHKDRYPGLDDGEYKPGFRQPRKVQLQYLRAPYETVRAQVEQKNPITPADVEAYYEKNKDTLYRSNPIPNLDGPEMDKDAPQPDSDPADKPESPDDADTPDAPKKDAPKTEEPAKDAAKPDAAPDDKPAQKPAADQPADKPAEEKPADKPADKPAPPPADADKSDKPEDAAAADSAAQSAVTRTPFRLASLSTEAQAADEPGTDASQDAPPADDKPAEKPADKPAEDKPADKPAETPAKPEPAADKPAEKTDDQPAEKKDAPPADDKPADDKPADAPAKPKSADDKPADKPAPESPADEDDQPAADKPAPAAPAPQYKPLTDELREEIAGELLRERVRDEMLAQAASAAEAMSNAGLEFNTRLTTINPSPEQSQELVKEARAALQKLATDKGFQFGETDLVSAVELSELPGLGKAQEPSQEFARNVPSLVSQAFSSVALVSPAQAEDLATSDLYVYWKVRDVAAHVPAFSEPGIQEQVLKAWKLEKARPLAQKRAEELAGKVRQSDQPMEAALGATTVTGQPNSVQVTVRESPEFSWLQGSSVPQFNFGGMRREPPRLADPLVVEKAGNRFMEVVFDTLEPKQVGVAPNEDQTVLYVVKVLDRTPLIRDAFVKAVSPEEQMGMPSAYDQLASQEQQLANFRYSQELEKRYAVKWNRVALEEPAE